MVDDGSTDGSGELALELFGDRLTYVKQKNSGVSAARNAGIGLASNEYVCLLDADDQWMPEYLETMHKLIAHYPQAVFWAINHHLIDESGKSFPSAIGVSPGFEGMIEDFPATFSRGYGLVSSSSVCIRKSIFSKGMQFPLNAHRGEDLVTWLELGMMGPMAFSSKPLARIRLDASNRSVKRKSTLPFQFEWYFSAYTRISSHRLGESVKSFVHGNALVTCYGLCLAGDRGSARKIIKLYVANKNIRVFLMLPALIMPRKLLNLIMKWRRSKR